MHKVTVSDEQVERQIYERAARQEEAFIMTAFKTLVEKMPPPNGWHVKKGPGRPRKKRVCHPEDFTWQSMTLVLMLKTHHALTDRETTSHLNANPGLREQLGLPRAPSPKTIQRALDRLPEAWLKELNHRLAGLAKKGAQAVRQTRFSDLMRRGSNSRAQAHGSRYDSTRRPEDATTENSASYWKPDNAERN